MIFYDYDSNAILGRPLKNRTPALPFSKHSKASTSTYEFVKRVPNDPHIVTAGHLFRPVCTLRSTNRVNTVL